MIDLMAGGRSVLHRVGWNRHAIYLWGSGFGMLGLGFLSMSALRQAFGIDFDALFGAGARSSCPLDSPY